MDSLFMDQHFLRNSLRLYSGDPLDAENNNASSLFSAAMMEKARAHIQMWGRTGGTPYNPSDLHALLLSGPGQQVYLGQRTTAMPMTLSSQLWSPSGSTSWQSPSIHGGLPPGLLGPPPPHRPQITPPPPPPSSTPSSSGSPSPTSVNTTSDLRLPKALFPSGMHRFSPYATHHTSLGRQSGGSPVSRPQ